MLRCYLVALLLLAGVRSAWAVAPSPAGRWITANHAAVIEIAPCGGQLCGQIIGIATKNPGDTMPRAWAGQPQCGMVILQTAPTAGAWVGSVLDPRDGSVYRARMMLDTFRHLVLHGYIGLPIFGQTQVWTPFSGQTLAGCRLADAAGRPISSG